MGVLHNFSTHLIVGLVNYSHSPELLITVQVSPLKWLLTSGQDSRDDFLADNFTSLAEICLFYLASWIFMQIFKRREVKYFTVPRKGKRPSVFVDFLYIIYINWN